MIFVVAGVELGRLAEVVFFRADEVGSVTEGLCGGGIATTGLDVTSSFLCFLDGPHICRTDSQEKIIKGD